MTDFTYCEDLKCGAVATVAFWSLTRGVDFDGVEKWFRIEQVVCAAGHHLTRTSVEEEEVEIL